MAWDYTQGEEEKQAKKDPVWYLERLINYGLKGKKLDVKLIKKYLPQLNIEDDAKAFLELLVWNKPL